MSVRGAWLEGAALIAIAFLPLAAGAWRDDPVRCAQDGARVQPEYQVVVDLGEGVVHRFCGVACADRWMMHSGLSAHSIQVTDSAIGGLVDADSAFFVESVVDGRQDAPDPVRVFASRGEAMKHVRAYGGELLVGSRRPLQYSAFGQWEKALHDR